MYAIEYLYLTFFVHFPKGRLYIFHGAHFHSARDVKYAYPTGKILLDIQRDVSKFLSKILTEDQYMDTIDRPVDLCIILE